MLKNRIKPALTCRTDNDAEMKPANWLADIGANRKKHGNKNDTSIALLSCF